MGDANGQLWAVDGNRMFQYDKQDWISTLFKGSLLSARPAKTLGYRQALNMFSTI
jgi:hypothetical protein